MVTRLEGRLGGIWSRRRGSWWWATLVIVLPVVGLTATAFLVLLQLVDVKDGATRLEVIRTALAVGAGTGGVAALVLAGRRQWSTEVAHTATEHDASERRVTELYTRAVDQVGSEKAAVRLGGLYALERLGNASPAQQSTIGNVICAYLRMPYTAPDERRQEREIRQAALEILARHNRRDSYDQWTDLVIRLHRADLTEADLTDADLTNADLTGANLARARLAHANLTRATLRGADLTRATLRGANLTSANLINVNLTDADMTDVDLTDVDLGLPDM